jgi:putative lipoprotein
MTRFFQSGVLGTAFICLLMMVSCAVSEGSFISGTLDLQNGSELPPNTVIEVSLADVSLADAPMKVITKKRINPAQALPIYFSLEYDPKLIILGHSYAVSARIQSVEGKLLWINDMRYSVLDAKNTSITDEKAQTVKMVLKKVN